MSGLRISPRSTVGRRRGAALSFGIEMSKGRVPGLHASVCMLQVARPAG